MGNKLCPKIILEGTRPTFKTEIAFELNEHPRIVGPRKLISRSMLPGLTLDISDNDINAAVERVAD